MGPYYDPERPPQQNSNGGKGRWFMALLIALVGLVMFLSNMEKNPLTGERQFVAISPAQEVRLGLESAPEMAREMGGELPSSDPRSQAVSRIGQLLVSHMDAEESPWQFKFHLLKDPETVNAFALPGGQIFITYGLYRQLQNEAQLAGVLGHEMGHVIERHAAQQMAKSQFGQILVVAVGAAASNQGQGMGGYDPTMIAAMINKMVQLKYGRGDESEADTWGLKLMEKTGFNPQQMIKVMEVLKAASPSSGGSTPTLFQTHPNPDLRIQQITEYLKKNPPAAGLTNGGPLPHASGSQSSQEDDEGSQESDLERLLQKIFIGK